MTATEKDVKGLALRAIDKRAAELTDFARSVLNEPETGYREQKTAEKVALWMEANGLSPRTGIAVTGMAARLDAGRPGPNIAVLGELDGLLVPGHRHAHAQTGAAHACGHHAQLANMLGVICGLLADGVAGALSGSVTFMAVPAEEFIEMDYRQQLRDSGKIEFAGGKQEFVRLGEFDDVDIAMMTHTSSDGGGAISLGGNHNGMVGKKVTYLGTAAHAAAAPHLGVNALNAANIGLAAINARRETFKDQHRIRVHPIITHGGDSVNSVPSEVRIETYVRGVDLDSILDADRKVDAALRSGALAVGGQVRIETMPGYLPSAYDPVLGEVYRRNAGRLLGEENVRPAPDRASSSDMGDISQLMPAIHPWTNSASGRGHGIDYIVDDYGLAVTDAAKAMVATIVDLLRDGAAEAGKVIDSFEPGFTKETYLAQLRELRSDRTYSE